MNISPRNDPRLDAFTLIELLTVITIIAILMGLLFTGIIVAKDHANRAKARTDIAAVAGAVQAYFAEYGKYPIGDQTSAGPAADVIFGDAGRSNRILFDILTNLPPSPGVPNPSNPRGIVYYQAPNAFDASAPRSGFAPKGSANPGALMDPWGSEYRIAMDADFDKQITTLPYTDYTGANDGPRVGVAVYSLGKDKMLGNKGDNAYRNAARGTTSDDLISW